MFKVKSRTIVLLQTLCAFASMEFCRRPFTQIYDIRLLFGAIQIFNFIGASWHKTGSSDCKTLRVTRNIHCASHIRVVASVSALCSVTFISSRSASMNSSLMCAQIWVHFRPVNQLWILFWSKILSDSIVFRVTWSVFITVIFGPFDQNWVLFLLNDHLSAWCHNLSFSFLHFEYFCRFYSSLFIWIVRQCLIVGLPRFVQDETVNGAPIIAHSCVYFSRLTLLAQLLHTLIQLIWTVWLVNTVVVPIHTLDHVISLGGALGSWIVGELGVSDTTRQLIQILLFWLRYVFFVGEARGCPMGWIVRR